VTDSSTSNGSNFDISGDQIPGLTIHSLSAGADQYTLYTESAALAYKAYPVAIDQVELVMPFNDPALTTNRSTFLLVKLDPATVTFNGKNGKLNRDGDSTPGEAEEDAVYLYYTGVTQAAGDTAAPFTAPATGMSYYPGIISGYGPSGDFLTKGGNTLTITGFTVTAALHSAPTTVFDAATLIQAYVFQKYDRSAGTWNPLTPVSQSFATGALTITFGNDAPGNRDIVRYIVDPYRIVANVKAGGANGTTIRASYNQDRYKNKSGNISRSRVEWNYLGPFDNPAPNATPSLRIDSVTAINSTTAPGLQVAGLKGNYYLDLEVRVDPTGTGITTPQNQTLDIASLTAKGNIRVFQKEANSDNYGGDVLKEISIDPAKITLISGTQFRIYLPGDYTRVPDFNTPPNIGNLEIRIYNVSLNFRKDTIDTGDSATAYFFKPNGGVDETGVYRFEVLGPAS
jgi:hypothetical protein